MFSRSYWIINEESVFASGIVTVSLMRWGMRPNRSHLALISTRVSRELILVSLTVRL
ncbi:hypothetical protein D3C87_2087980 [compost metagenome]